VSVRVLAAVLTVACTHTSPNAAPIEPARREPVTCEAASLRALKSWAMALLFDQGVPHDDNIAVELMTRHCRDDNWSLDFRSCIVTTKSWDEALECKPSLTRAQLDAFSKDAEAHGFTVPREPPKR
jgi:hypothetical protein